MPGKKWIYSHGASPTSPILNYPDNRLYFAYGSNLSLHQMSRRCPETTFVGIGYLEGFRFQINQRGYANVVVEAGSQVWGMVYKLTERNEADLDRFEGYGLGNYEKHELAINLDRAIVHGNPDAVLPTSEGVSALVYISLQYCQDGLPWEDYVGRMRRGISDGIQHGISKQYFEEIVEPLLKVSRESTWV